MEDLFQVTVWAKKEYPDLPFILMGHSMGSLVVRTYAKEHDRELDAFDCVWFTEQELSAPLGAAVGHAEAAVLGDEASEQSSGGDVVWIVAARFADEERMPVRLVAVRTRRWCGSMKKTHFCGFTFR